MSETVNSQGFVHLRVRSAYSLLEGAIKAGKLADFVMLERDPHEVDPDDIKNIAVIRTVVGGRTVYPATT